MQYNVLAKRSCLLVERNEGGELGDSGAPQTCVIKINNIPDLGLPIDLMKRIIITKNWHLYRILSSIHPKGWTRFVHHCNVRIKCNDGINIKQTPFFLHLKQEGFEIDEITKNNKGDDIYESLWELTKITFDDIWKNIDEDCAKIPTDATLEINSEIGLEKDSRSTLRRNRTKKYRTRRYPL